jgi:UDP-N-acetylmuramate-alanine ligase
MLYYDPDTTLITTLSHDHVDIYPTLKDYFAAFKVFVLKTAKYTYGLTTDQGFQTLVKMLPDHTISKIKSLDVKSFDFTHLI